MSDAATATLVGDPMQVADGVGPQLEGRFLTSTLRGGMLGTMGLVGMVIRPCARAKSVRGARGPFVLAWSFGVRGTGRPDIGRITGWTLALESIVIGVAEQLSQLRRGLRQRR